MDGCPPGRDQLFAEAARAYGPALERLARFYEADPVERRDLLQKIHLALWRSFAVFDGRCSVRTWVFRVAHNAGATHSLSGRRRARIETTTLDALDAVPMRGDPEGDAADRDLLARLLALIHGLRPPDAQVMLLYLEDVPAAEIGEITGLSAGAVATRIHRIKSVLARHLTAGGRNDE